MNAMTHSILLRLIFRVMSVMVCCVLSPGERALAADKQGYDGAIELIQLSVDAGDDRLLHVVFRLDADATQGEIDFNLFDGETLETVDQLDIEDGLQEYGEQQGLYVHTVSVPNGYPAPYRMYLAFDEDGGGADAFTYIHGTVLLHPPAFDHCTQAVLLQWEEYRVWTHGQFSEAPGEPGMDIPFGSYQVIANGEELGSIPVGGQSHAVSLPEPGVYLFRIRAVSGEGGPEWLFSDSNTLEKSVAWPELHDLQIGLVDVVAPERADIHISAGGSTDAYVFRLLRRSEPGADPEPVAAADMEPGATTLSFADEVPGLDDHPWYYQVFAHVMDGDEECPEPAVASDVVSTLWFAAARRDHGEDRLSFTMEFDRDPEADSYVLQQMLPGDDTYGDVVEVPDSPFTHDLSDALPLAGELRFRMKGADGGEDFHSNEVLFVIEPGIDIPNAFRPETGRPENKVFKPRFIGFEPEYRIVIYDRNGLRVYDSGWPDGGFDPDVSWDGRIDGRPAPQGGYVYRIHYRSGIAGIGDGEKTGLVYLVR